MIDDRRAHPCAGRVCRDVSRDADADFAVKVKECLDWGAANRDGPGWQEPLTRCVRIRTFRPLHVASRSANSSHRSDRPEKSRSISAGSNASGHS